MGEGNIKHVSQRRLWGLSNLDFLVWSSIKIGWQVKTLWEVSTWTMANPWLDSAVCQLFFFFFLIMWSQIVLYRSVFSFSYECWLWNTDTCDKDLSYTWSGDAQTYLFSGACVFVTKRLRMRGIKTFENIKQNSRKLRTWERVKGKRKYTKF